MLGPEEMEIDKVDTFTSAGPSVHESSLVAVHEFKVHYAVRLVPFFKTASALQWQGNIKGDHADFENVALDHELIPTGSHSELPWAFKKFQWKKGPAPQLIN